MAAVIAGDIGSTRSYMGIYEQDKEGKPVLVFPSNKPKQYDSAKYRSLEEMTKAFLDEANINEPICAACFGISGQPENGYIIGLDWNISQNKLCDFLVEHSWKKRCDDARIKKLPVVTLVYSMEAIEFNELLKSEGLVDLNGEANVTNDQDKNGLPFKRALIGVRGGLGEALVYWGRPPENEFGDVRFNISPSEGGHANLAPSSKKELELINYLLEHPEHLEHTELVTYRDVLSEKGIVRMYQFFKDNKEGEASDDIENLVSNQDFSLAAREIIRAALEEKNNSCVQAIDLFFSIYGAEAGNLALRYYALGGVYYIHGSITPPELVDKLIDKLRHGAFMQAFTRRAKPELIDFLKSIPVKFVQDFDIRLHGAARRALKKEQFARIIYDRCK